MKSYCVVITVTLALCLTSNVSHAGILAGMLTFDGAPDKLDDDTLLRIVSTDDVLSTGDVLYGVWRIDRVNGVKPSVDGVSPAGIIGIFSYTIDAVTATGATLRATEATSDFSVKKLLDDAGHSTSGIFSEIASATYDDAAFAILEVAELDGAGGGDDSNNPFDRGHTESTSDEIITTTMTADNGYEVAMIGGFDPNGTNQHGDADFAMIEGLNIFGDPGGPLPSISSAETEPHGQTQWIQKGGFSILHDVFGGNTYLPTTSVSTDHDIVMYDSLITSHGGVDPLWSVSGDTNLELNTVVPEPATMAIWAVLGLGATIGYRRNRRKSLQVNG